MLTQTHAMEALDCLLSLCKGHQTHREDKEHAGDILKDVLSSRAHPSCRNDSEFLSSSPLLPFCWAELLEESQFSGLCPFTSEMMGLFPVAFKGMQVAQLHHFR